MSNIKVSTKDWNSISSKDQEKITGILRSSGLISEQSKVVGEDSIEQTVTTESVCTKACDVAASAAHIACNALPWPADDICNLAANAAEGVCKEACDI